MERCVRIYFRKRGFIFMKYINELREGNRISGIYLCKHKQSAVTKNGKQYENVILQDKTGNDRCEKSGIRILWESVNLKHWIM